MYRVTIDYAQKHFAEIIERAKYESEGVLIVQDNKSFLLNDKDELDAWKETTEILKDASILSDREEARKEYKKDETLTMEDIFELDND